MQVLLEKQDDSNVILDITIPRAEVDKEIDSIAKNLKERAQVNGFRKGAAPLDLIKRHFHEALRAEASTRLIQSGVIEGLKQEKLRNIGNPVLLDEFKVSDKKRYPGKFKLDGSFNFKITVMLPPNIDVSNYTGIEVEVDAKDFGRWFAKQIRKQQLLFGDKQTVERSAQVGDQVMVDFEGFIDGTALNGAKEENISFVIGEETLIKELENVFVGKNTNDEFEQIVKFPDNYPVSNLRDKEVLFKCKVKEVVELKPHELNEAFATLLSFDSVDALMADYQAKWEDQYESVIKTQIFASVMDKLIEAIKFEAPQSWVEQELRVVASRLQMRVQDVLNNPSLHSQLMPIAEKTVKSAYILDKIYEKETSLRLLPEEVTSAAEKAAVAQSMSTSEFLEQLRERGMYEGFITQCEHRKVMEFLVANASVKEKV